MAFCFAPPTEISRAFQGLGGRTLYPLHNCWLGTQRVSYPRLSRSLCGLVFSRRSRSFSDTELAEDAAEEILGIMSPDDITDGIERASKLNRNELG